MARGSASGSVVECPSCGQPNLRSKARCIRCNAALPQIEKDSLITWDLLVSTRGRIGRSTFWPIILGSFVGAFVVTAFSGGFIVAAVALCILYAGVVSMIKRLHDRNKSGHWLWLFIVGPLFGRLAIDPLLKYLQISPTAASSSSGLSK